MSKYLVLGLFLCSGWAIISSCNPSSSANSKANPSWQFQNNSFRFFVKHDSFIRTISIVEKETNQQIQSIAIATELETYIDALDWKLHEIDSSDLFVLQDVNFDGYQDIQVLNWLDHRFIARTYRYWCYDSVTNSFVRDSLLEEIISPIFFDSLHQIQSVFRWGCCYNDTLLYELKNKQLDTIRHTGDNPSLEEMFGIEEVPSF